MTYREHIYMVCKNTDLTDEKDVTETISYLAEELMQFNDLARSYEKKVKELMSAKDWEEWSIAEAKKLFRKKIERCEDEEFKSFVLEHFDEITEENYA